MTEAFPGRAKLGFDIRTEIRAVRGELQEKPTTISTGRSDAVVVDQPITQE